MSYWSPPRSCSFWKSLAQSWTSIAMTCWTVLAVAAISMVQAAWILHKKYGSSNSGGKWAACAALCYDDVTQPFWLDVPYTPDALSTPLMGTLLTRALCLLKLLHARAHTSCAFIGISFRGSNSNLFGNVRSWYDWCGWLSIPAVHFLLQNSRGLRRHDLPLWNLFWVCFCT